jgi:MFS family permease
VNGALRRLGLILLPRNPAGRTLAIGAGVDSLGTGMFFASFALYFVGVVGIPAEQVALAATVAGALALLAPVPLGRLADRLGTGRFYVALLLLRGLGYGCFAFVDDFTSFLLLTVLLTAADRSSSPIQQAVVTALIGGQERTRTMASIRAVRNVGLTVGFLLAGGAFAAARPALFTLVFMGNGLSFVVVAAMVSRALSRSGALVGRTTPAAPGPPVPAAAQVRSPFRDRWFMVFTVSNGVLSLYDTVLIVLLPIWVTTHTAVPVAWVPVLMAVNTVLTVLLQVYVARFADGPAAATRLLVLSGALMAVCCGFLALGQTASASMAIFAILVAVVVLSVAENLHAVAAWELSAELSPEAARARYLGAFSLAVTGQKVVGPTLLVVVLMPTGLIAWPALAAAFGTAAVVSRTAARRCVAEREATTALPLPTPQPIEVNS